MINIYTMQDLAFFLNARSADYLHNLACKKRLGNSCRHGTCRFLQLGSRICTAILIDYIPADTIQKSLYVLDYLFKQGLSCFYAGPRYMWRYYESVPVFYM